MQCVIDHILFDVELCIEQVVACDKADASAFGTFGRICLGGKPRQSLNMLILEMFEISSSDFESIETNATGEKRHARTYTREEGRWEKQQVEGLSTPRPNSPAHLSN